MLGVLSVVVGLLLIRHPIQGVTAVALLLGVWLVAAGVVRLIGAFEDPEHRGRRIVSAAVLGVAGVIIVASPHIGYATLALIAGLGFIAYGLSLLVLGWSLRVVRELVRAGRADPRAELSPRRRRIAATALAVLAGVLLGLAGVLAYVRSEVAGERAFAGRLTAALDDGAVRAVVADRSVDALVGRASADVLAVRPLATAAVRALAATPAFGRVAARAATDVHRQVVGGRPEVVLRLDRGGPVLQDALRSVSPALAARTAEGATPVLATLERGDGLTALRRVLDASAWWWALLAGAAVSAAAALRVGPDVRGTLVALGAAAAVAGAVVAGLEVGAGAVVAERAAPGSGAPGDRRHDAVAATWTALFGDLRTAALVMAAGGLAVAALAWALPGHRPAAAPGDPAGRGRRRGGALVAGAALVALAAAALTASVLLAAGGPAAPAATAAAPRGGCNGSVALCGRRLDDVVFAGTHNSYAAADEPGWLFANQRHGIARQLDDGIRALLLDVHAGVRDPDTGRVRTDLRAEGMTRNKVAEAIGPRALRTADRLAGRVGAGDLRGRRGTYLCHTLCELGRSRSTRSSRWSAASSTGTRRRPPRRLRAVRAPGGDRGRPAAHGPARRGGGPRPRRAAADARRARRRRPAARALRRGGRWARPWYPPAFSFVQDTPLGARRPAELSCRRFRGEPSSPLLLLNHWIDRFPPRPSDNAPIGTAAFLRDRIRRCTAQRRIRGAIVAVDFSDRTRSWRSPASSIAGGLDAPPAGAAGGRIASLGARGRA